MMKEYAWITCKVLFWIVQGGFALSRADSCSSEYLYDNHPCIKVTGVLVEPYLMEDSQGSLVGLIPSLLDELGRDLGFSYVLDYLPDGNYGFRRLDNSWSGIIGLLVENKVDVGAAPLYETHDRAQVVNFTMPYLTVQGTLITKPPTDITISPHISLEAFLRGAPSLVGTMSRGVVVHSFRNTNDPFLRQLWRGMITNSKLTLTQTNLEGIERVRTENYSFIMPHTIGEYLAGREPCDLITVGRFLMDRGYSLAIRKNLKSFNVQDFNRALKRLEKRGIIQELYTHWWLDSSSCGDLDNPLRYRKSDIEVGQAAPSTQNEAAHFSSSCLLVILFRYL